MTKTEVHHHEFKAKVVAGLDAMLKEPGKYSSGYAVDRVYEAGYVAGMAMARRLLRLQLGLGVPEDTEAEPAPLTERVSELEALLREVSEQYTRDDDLPDELLPRIDAALEAQNEKQT